VKPTLRIAAVCVAVTFAGLVKHAHVKQLSREMARHVDDSAAAYRLAVALHVDEPPLL
jgi:hypothetical protein